MTDKTADSTAARPSPPRFVVLAAGALVLSGIFSVIASLTLFGGATDKGGWLYKTSHDANAKLVNKDGTFKKGHLSEAKLLDRIDSTPKSLLVTSIVVLVAVSVLAAAAYRGKYWARWATLGLWVLATVTQTLAGIGSLLLISSSDVDLSFRGPAFVSALAFVAAVVLTQMRPSTEFFKLTKPVRPAAGAGAAPARRGLFAPRPATGRAAGAAASSSASSSRPNLTKQRGTAQEPAETRPAAADRARSKARANSESVARGAELARSRAKASKSRRTGA